MKKLVALLLFLLFRIPFSEQLHPIILVPGDGGSQMEAKLNKTSVVHYLCDKTTKDYFNIWLNLELLVPLVIDCWIDNVRLEYNVTSRTTHNSPGVEIRVPGFGNTTTVEYLDPSQASPGLYFKSIVEAALIPLGYERNADIRGAPYDFRKAPNEMQDWLLDFKKLVEHSYDTNGNSSVVLLCHSMGSPLSLYFLHRQSQSWKDKYIRALITLGGVWGGSVKALKVFAAGDDLGAYVLPSRTLRGQQRTNPSTAWLLPSKLFWKDDETLVQVPGKNYTIQDYETFFNDIHFPVGNEMYKDTRNLLGNLEHPGVEMHCLHGSGVSTVEKMSYTNNGEFPDKPTLTMGNGDGTVNIRSLRGCMRWQTGDSVNRAPSGNSLGLRNKRKWRVKQEAVYGKNAPKVFHQEFSGVDHMAILADPQTLSYIKKVVHGMNAI